MRIVMLTSNYRPFVGGVPISIERLADGLRGRGHMVFLFAPAFGGAETGDDRYTYRFRTVRPLQRGGFRLSQLFDPSVERMFPDLGADVIHVHDPFLVGRLALALGRRYGVPVVFTHHTRYEQYLHYVRAYAAAERYAREGHPVAAGLLRELRETWLPGYVTDFENRCDAVIAPSESLRRELLERGVYRSVHVLPTGLPETAFARDDLAAARLRRSLLGGRRYLLYTVSRLGREKELDVLLRAAASLRERIGDTFRLAVIGEGPERAALESLRDRLGLAETVVFPGAVENARLADYHRAGDLFLFTSHSETQGVVLLEAMAAGRPVAALRAPGAVDLVRDGVNGRLTCEAEFVPAVAALLADPALRRRLSGQALETARRFTVEAVAHRAEALYSALSGPARASALRELYARPAGGSAAGAATLAGSAACAADNPVRAAYLRRTAR